MGEIGGKSGIVLKNALIPSSVILLTACERVAQFLLKYTPEIFNDLCALSQNSKIIYCMEKVKLWLNL